MVSLMFEPSEVIKLRFFSKGDSWSVIISLFSGSQNTILPTEIQLHKFNLQKKIPFQRRTYTHEQYQ